MGAESLGPFILWLIVLAVVIVIAVYLLRWLYRRSTKEIVFVRTGFGGEKVVISGGAFVIPVLHEITPVGMNVMRIEVVRRESQALITRDRIRVDASARRIALLIDQEEFSRRRAAWNPRRRATPLAGALEKYASQVGSAHLGAVTHSGNLQWDFEEPEKPSA